MDRFDAMQAFARVVETGSFTKAADTLHMSRTTVTQLVQHLEARLRVRLLNRTTRQVNVTADGAAYYARVIRLLADIDDAETSLSTAAAAPRGRLRVDVPAPFARLVLVPALPDFLVRYPEIQLDLGVSDRHVDLIDENVDCVIRGGQITDQSLVARHIGDLQAGIHASPAYLQARGEPAQPDQLPAHDVISYSLFSAGEHWRFAGPAGEVTVKVAPRMRTNSGDTCRAAALQAQGIILQPSFLVGADLAEGRLKEIMPDYRADTLGIYAVYPSRKFLAPKVRVAIDFLTEVFAAPVWGN